MNDQKAGNFFGACLEIMSEGFAGANDELASIEAQAKAFLTSIGYLASTGEERRHCRALLALAERFSDTSIFPNKRAPGATFFAGIIEPKSFGVRGHGDILQSPSGRGLNLKGAFESCLGEAAEYLSFIEHDEDPLIQSTEQSAGLDEAELAWACAGVGIEADAMKIARL